MAGVAVELMHMPERVGASTMRGVRAVVETAALLAGALAAACVPGNWSAPAWRRLVRHIHRAAVEPLGITLFVSLITGLVLTVQVVNITRSIGQLDEVGHYLALLHVREIGPALVNLIIIGCAGAGIASEIGLAWADRPGGEAASQRDPVAVEVMPRVLGVGVGALCLTILFDAVGLVAGYAVTRGFGLMALPVPQFTHDLFASLTGLDYGLIAIKTMLPAMTTVAIACVVGRRYAQQDGGVPWSVLPSMYGGSVFALFAIAVAVAAVML